MEGFDIERPNYSFYVSISRHLKAPNTRGKWSNSFRGFKRPKTALMMMGARERKRVAPADAILGTLCDPASGVVKKELVSKLFNMEYIYFERKITVYIQSLT